jgi:transposase
LILTGAASFEDNGSVPCFITKEQNMGKEAKYVIRLTEEERSALPERMGKPRVAAAKVLRARMVLKADVDGPGWSDPKIAEAFAVGVSTIHRLRQRLVEEGLEAALSRRPSSQQRVPKLDGAKEARLIAIACSSPPEGRARWTLKLLADQLVELDIVDDISSETVRQTRKKMHASHGGSGSG